MHDPNDPNKMDPVEKAEGSEMLVNAYGSTHDDAVVVEEPTRTVLLTNDETIVVEKQEPISIAPVNRKRKVYAGMWGPIEIATAGIAFMTVLLVVLVYVFLVLPSNRELEKNRAEVARLEQERTIANARYGDITSTESQVSKLVLSADDFETRYLPIEITGRTALYQRINGLIGAYGLVNTTGPDFAPLETADQGSNNQSDEEKGRAKFRSLFPGIYITMTVEGSYQNLRRFIREIETGNDFIAISAVELEPSDSSNGGGTSTAPNNQSPPSNSQFPQVNNPTAGPGSFPSSQPVQTTASRPRGKTHGEVVRLRLEMAAYFRRPNASATVAPEIVQ